MWNRIIVVSCIVVASFVLSGCQSHRNAILSSSLDNLPLLSNAQTRSISPENFTGEKGKGGMATEGTGKNAGRELGQKWKISPSIVIKAGATFTLADIAGPGMIQHIWMTPTGDFRQSILRMYWDDEKQPSVEVPVGDFFGNGWGRFAPITSLAVCANPGSGFNCYWPMPFRKQCRVTFENLDSKDMVLYFQIDYTLGSVPRKAAYFHAQFRRVNPLPTMIDYTILDNVIGKGQYVGTTMCWGSNSPGWWGEGEIKFFMDGDKEFPTICGTGTEDYFCGSYGFMRPGTEEYMEFSSPYAGMPQALKPDTNALKQPRFGLYRWHLTDPIRFEKDLRVTIQSLGWQSEGRYLHLKDDLASTAFWFQTEPHNAFPALPAKDTLVIKW
jgi:hypothetical protein